MPAPPRRGRPPRHNRGDILDAASEVMIFRGYGSTRYSDVAEASGVPVASLQHHFPTLAVLRREALRNKVRAELTSLAEQVALITDPWERVYHIIVTSISLKSEGTEAGRFRPECTAQEAAIELHSLIDGLGFRLAVAHEDEDAAEAIMLLERAARRMLIQS